jgi:hypothetical protein
MINEKDKLMASYSESLIEFIVTDRLLVVSGYSVKFHNGKDLYGFDVAIKLHSKFINDGLDTRLLLVIPDLNKKSLEYLEKLIIQNGVTMDSCYILSGQISLWPLFTFAKLFLRPTLTDGYGVSVAESVFLGCNTLASDVCERYDGAYIYAVDDFEELYNKALYLIK